MENVGKGKALLSALAALGAEFEIGEVDRTRGLRASFGEGLRLSAGWRMDAGRGDREVWDDAADDLLCHSEAWYRGDVLSPCPVGGSFSSVEEFQLLMSALMPGRS